MPGPPPGSYDGPVSRRYLLDTALALGLAVASMLAGAGFVLGGPSTEKLTQMYGSAGAWQRAELTWWLLGALCVAGLVIQHRWPLPGVVLAGLGAGGHLLNPRIGPLPLDLAAPIALYTLATLARSRRTPWLAVTAMAVATYVLTFAGQYAADRGAPAYPGAKATVAEPVVDVETLLSAAKASVGVLLVLGLSMAIGVGTRNRRALLVTLEQRAADLEREQDQRAALATAAERARITRELHDIVAHGLSVMVVQAQGAAAAQARHPDRTAAALQDIIATGRASLAEMRRLLGVVREAPQLAPQPGIAALPALVDQVRAAGTRVRLDVEGEPVPLPAGVDLSAYRIVQEALTNTLKHAGPGAQALVRLGFTAERLEVEVSDDGAAEPVLSTVDNGNGLRGIAERVGMLHGELTAGPGPEGGFRVRALLPIEAVGLS
jgi:signal transduction histidine kinase